MPWIQSNILPDPKRIDGKAIAEKIQLEIKEGVEQLFQQKKVTPGTNTLKTQINNQTT